MSEKLSPNPARPVVQDLRNIEEFKAFLGPVANGYNSAQLRQLQREMFAMAELLLDLYLDKKRKESRHFIF
jgi:hypothetical protein